MLSNMNFTITVNYCKTIEGSLDIGSGNIDIINHIKITASAMKTNKEFFCSSLSAILYQRCLSYLSLNTITSLFSFESSDLSNSRSA